MNGTPCFVCHLYGCVRMLMFQEYFPLKICIVLHLKVSCEVEASYLRREVENFLGN
jgi:hypothetical protein